MATAIIAAIKLILILGGSILEFIRALMDISAMVKKMIAESRAHLRESLARGKKHYHKKRVRHD